MRSADCQGQIRAARNSIRSPQSGMGKLAPPPTRACLRVGMEAEGSLLGRIALRLRIDLA
jgi:hypothetical protein